MEFKREYTVEIKLSDKNIKELINDFELLTELQTNLLSETAVKFYKTLKDIEKGE